MLVEWEEQNKSHWDAESESGIFDKSRHTDFRMLFLTHFVEYKRSFIWHIGCRQLANWPRNTKQPHARVIDISIIR